MKRLQPAEEPWNEHCKKSQSEEDMCASGIAACVSGAAAGGGGAGGEALLALASHHLQERSAVGGVLVHMPHVRIAGAAPRPGDIKGYTPFLTSFCILDPCWVGRRKRDIPLLISICKLDRCWVGRGKEGMKRDIPLF